MGNSGGKHQHSLVGLVGPAGAGKDTVAELLVANHGFRRVGFADRIREFTKAIDPGWALADTVLGYERAKREVGGFRQKLIEVGEAARTHINSEVWVDAVDDLVAGLRDSVPVVVADVRQYNEADWINDCGGWLVAVDRPGLVPENDAMHDLIASADAEVYNGGTTHALAAEVDAFVAWLGEQ